MKINLRLLILLSLCGTVSVPALEQPVGEAVIRENFKAIYDLFERADPGKHQHFPRELEKNDEVEFEFSNVRRIQQYTISGKIYAQFDALTGMLIGAYDKQLGKINSDFHSQRVPGLTVTEAMAKAEGYLTAVGMTLPTDHEVAECSFGVRGHAEWRVIWVKKYGDYRQSTEGGAHILDSMEVRFHEKYGLIRFSNCWNGPAPKSLEVKVSLEQALGIFDRAFPAIEEVWIYKSWTPGPMLITKIQKAELAVSYPNWWLDPARRTLMPTEPIQERRLCWVILAILTEANPEDASKPINHRQTKELSVSIDAATGEVIRFNIK